MSQKGKNNHVLTFQSGGGLWPFWDPAAATSQPLYLNKYGLHCYVIYINLYSSKKIFFEQIFFHFKIPYEGETELTIKTLELTIETFQL